MSVVIRVENLSKQYRLGQVGTGTISHDINRWWHRIRGKEDPYLKIGETNDRTSKGSSDYVWALKDINFEVKQGEVLGIIGRNGAGKSTLLKILSRTTAPTTGSVKIKGRVASLLEVGTGFHPELSGRDNIFLNGAIMGMTRREIQSKFDEIVDFAGVERYIDTPVKRYSSGMYVRLAFAVAAHLDPEILIVDEVLAVGDAEFQKKCLGKMKDVSEKQGRTVLFVSHNVSAIQALSKRALLVHHGEIVCDDDTELTIKKHLYFNNPVKQAKYKCVFDLDDENKNRTTNFMRFSSLEVLDIMMKPLDRLITGQPALFKIEYTINDSSINYDKLHFSLIIKNYQGLVLSVIQSYVKSGFFKHSDLLKSNILNIRVNSLPLVEGDYLISINIVDQKNWTYIDNRDDCLIISVQNGLIYNNLSFVQSGHVIIDAVWELE